MHETEWGALVLAIAIAIALYAYGKGYKHGKQEAANGRR